MANELKNYHFDRRTVDRYRDKGIVSQAEYDKYVKNLPDDSASAQWVEMDLHDAELGTGAEDHDHDSEDT